jgi:hypothetical protein
MPQQRAGVKQVCRPTQQEETMKQPRISRRGLVKGSLMAAAAGGTATFFGPWRQNTAYAQTKPIKLGLTCDGSGQFGNSGQDDLRAIRMAIDDVNAKGGVLGRKIEWITADTESSPATGTRVAERFITRDDCAILIGADSGSQCHTQVANKYRIYLNQLLGAGDGELSASSSWGRQRHEFLESSRQECGPLNRQELAAAHE